MLRLAGDMLFLTAFYDGPLMLKLHGTQKPTVAWQGHGTGEHPDETDGLHSIMVTPFLKDGYIYGVGEDHHVDSGGATPQQCPRAAVHGRPRRQYIVDQHEFAPGHFGLTLGGYAECPLDVLRPSGLAQPDLLRRGLDALERAVEHDSGRSPCR